MPAKERMKESEMKAEKQREFDLAATVLRGDDDHEYDKYLVSFDDEDIKAYVRKYIEASDYDAAVTAVTEAVQNAQGRMKENKIVKFLSGTVQIDADLKNPPLLEGGIPAPKPWIEVPADDTNDGRGYDVDYTPLSSLGWIFNSANVCRAVIFGTYATRGEAWLASEAFNTIEAKRQRRIQG